MTHQVWPFPWPADQIAHYTAYRIEEALSIDGHLDESAWQLAPRSPRFVDLISGQPAIHDTCAAVLWDDTYLYIGFWIEEPQLAATLTERDALVWTENDVEVFIAGKDAYYEFEVNPLGTIYEALFIWEDAYERGGFAADPNLRRGIEGQQPFNGVGFTTHPRGERLGFFRWDMPGLRWAVALQGSINDPTIRDNGWTVEIAIPWEGMRWLAQADGRALPPQDGDTWRMDFSRFNQYKAASPAQDSGGWAWSAHGIWDSHIPECFPFIHFSKTPVELAIPAWQAEIVDLHSFFQAWLNGSLVNDDFIFRRLMSVLAPDFTLISPSGEISSREQLLTQLRKAHGSRPGWRMWIEKPQLRSHSNGLVITTYEEWQRTAERTTVRLSTAIFQEQRGTAHGLAWLHVHETWLEAA